MGALRKHAIRHICFVGAPTFVFLVSFVANSSLWPSSRASAQATGHQDIPYADAKPVLETLKPDLIPAELRVLSAAEREAAWPAWTSRRDADIRARLAAGDEDSVVTFLLFGVTFTAQPRFSFNALVANPALRNRAAEIVAADPVVQARIRDLAAAASSSGSNERVEFVRQVLAAHHIDPSTAVGRIDAVRFLGEALRGMVAGYSEFFRDAEPGATLFRNRGLSSDTSIYASFAIDAALADASARGGVRAGSIARVAIVGPGLDFTDKQDGYDFYPVQTIQPFAVVDSLRRLRLAAPGGVSVTTFDVSPRVNRHIEEARIRAGRGTSYTIQLPRDTAMPWSAPLAAFWQNLGSHIGAAAKPIGIPSALSHLRVRAVAVNPDVVRSIDPRDLDIIVQRPDPLPSNERYDLVVATNILIYYDVFEQSLALSNIAHMLRPAGILLTNNPLFELPSLPMHQVGETHAIYTSGGGDWVAWYQRE